MGWKQYKNPVVDAKHFVGTLSANVDNPKMSDAEFRNFVLTTLPIVEGALYKDIPSFEVGDTIMIDNTDIMTHGKEGTVLTLPDNNVPKYEVSFPNGWVGWYNPSELRLIKKAA